jgi:isopentenyl-diphosphate delta-isomerase
MQNHNIVSDPAEQLILVDSDDQEVGCLSKSDCHEGAGVLHRAFSIFLFNTYGEILMQRRSAEKPLWPLYWSNSCCSHPRAGETTAVALQRRLQEELGVQCPLTFLYKFEYQVPFGDLGAECEVCSVYRGTYDGELNINETEIAEVRYLAPEALLRQVEQDPDSFTPWFKMELEKITSEFQDPA